LKLAARIKSAIEKAGLTQDSFSETHWNGSKKCLCFGAGDGGRISGPPATNMPGIVCLQRRDSFESDKQGNDVQALTARLARLSPKQFEITKGI
jgi:hypothetical protein